MIFKQYYLGCLAHASYLVADEVSRDAVVVDPQRDVDQYVEDARTQDLRIRHVILTHFHADFVAGHLELRDRVGARIHIGRRGEAAYEHVSLADGDELHLGPTVKLAFLETPGHTPEGVSILVYDLGRSPHAPHAVLTGDTLFVGDVGRPDLMASIGITARQLAVELYDSLREKLLPLPDETLVYPSHGAGSMCGKNLGKETFSTMGEQRRYNYALAPMSREQFVELVTADQPEAPSYFSYDAQMNRQERPTLPSALATGLRPLSLPAALDLKAAGAQLLDVREAAEFEAAHVAGAVNVGLGGKFATWAGTVLRRDRPIVLIADPGREEEAGVRLGRIGFDHVAGFLDGGMAALDSRPDLLRRTDRITASTLREQLASPDPPAVLDVRGSNERATGAIEGSVHVPLPRLLERLSDVPRRRRLVVHCASGYRSAIAVSLLEAAGVGGLVDLVGGMAAWDASAGRTPASCGTG